MTTNEMQERIKMLENVLLAISDIVAASSNEIDSLYIRKLMNVQISRISELEAKKRNQK